MDDIRVAMEKKRLDALSAAEPEEEEEPIAHNSKLIVAELPWIP